MTSCRLLRSRAIREWLFTAHILVRIGRNDHETNGYSQYTSPNHDMYAYMAYESNNLFAAFLFFEHAIFGLL
jgi:hypothetical protein